MRIVNYFFKFKAQEPAEFVPLEAVITKFDRRIMKSGQLSQCLPYSNLQLLMNLLKEKVKLQNLVSFSLVQDKLADNFKAILQHLEQEKLQRQSIRRQLQEMRKTKGPLDSQLSKELAFVKQRFDARLKKLQDLNKKKMFELKSKEFSQHQNVQSRPRPMASQQELPVSLISKIQFDDLSKRVEHLDQQLSKASSSIAENERRSELSLKELEKNILQMTWSKIEQDFKEVKTLVQSSRNLKEIQQKIIRMNSIMDQGLLTRVLAIEDRQNLSIIDQSTVNSHVQNQHFKQRKELQRLAESVTEMTRKSKEAQLQRRVEEVNRTVDQLNLRIENIGQLENRTLSLQNRMNDFTQEKQAQRIEGIKIGFESVGKQPSQAILAQINILKDRVYDKINKLTASLNSYVSRTQFAAQKEFLREKVKRQEKLLTQEQATRQVEVQSLKKQINEFVIPQAKDFSPELSEIRNQIQLKISFFNRKTQQLSLKVDSLRHDLRVLKQEQEERHSIVSSIDTSVMKVNLGKERSFQSESRLNKQQLDQIRKVMQGVKRIQDHRLSEFKGEISMLFKDYQKKLQFQKDLFKELELMKQQFYALRQSSQRKADAVDTKKQLSFLDSKIKALFVKLLQQKEKDGSLARKSWICLSCQKSLISVKNSTEKVVWQNLPEKSNLSKRRSIKHQQRQRERREKSLEKDMAAQQA